MPRLTAADESVFAFRPGPVRAILMSLGRFLSGVPLFFCGTPKTPLRVLCVIALDIVHVLRNGRPLPRSRRKELAAFLDFQACSNAAWDGKELGAREHQALREGLERAGLNRWITGYLNGLHELESRRPTIGGDHERFVEVRAYREAVARLSLAAITAIALGEESLDASIRATYRDQDVATLFRMAMQCQIIDDVIDYKQDLAAGLPSFLTASASRPRAVALTADSVWLYAASRGSYPRAGAFPLEAALYGITLVAKLVVATARAKDGRQKSATTEQRSSPS